MSQDTITPPVEAVAARPRRRRFNDRNYDPMSTAIGLGIVIALCLVAVIWRIKTFEKAEREALQDFECKLDAPQPVEYKVPNPTRDFLKVADTDSVNATIVEERPEIHMTRVASDTPVYTEVIEAPTRSGISTSDVKEFKINLKDFEPGAVEKDVVVDDNPETISFTAERVEYAVPVIGVVTKAPGDLFKYDQPLPPDRIGTHVFNVGPRPGRAMRRMAEAFGDQSSPSFGTLGPANINLFGTSDIFRTGSRAGGLRTKSAVDSALHWLAIHQEPNGLWDCSKHEGAEMGNIACTGLSVLALMSGGHTVRKGEYSRNVLKGIEALMRHQQDDGRIGIRNETLYTHAICAITLAEAYGRARDERVGAAAQKALNFAERAVAKDGGWRYQPNPPASDMSVTAWFVQALKTGRLAGLKTDQRLYNQALTYVDSLTDKNGGRDTDGTVSYTYSTEGGHSGNRIAMTAAGMMIREFNGVPPHSPVLQRGAELIKRHPPNWKQKDFYYWYYATYAMHNMGGANRIWWNQRVRDVLLDNQSRDGDRAGSWDPTGDHWANRAGGRVYTTALGALCLEVYYRYSEALTAFGTAPDLDDFLLE